MGNFKKVYIGAISNEEDAAQLYDKIAIIIHGLKVSYPCSYDLIRPKQISTTQREIF
jgi:hypothetical protein